MRSLEKSLVKYRSYEMLLILFYSEQIRESIVSSLIATQELGIAYNYCEERLIDRGKANLNEKVYKTLVKESVIVEKEADELKSIINYRNDIAHRTNQIFYDVASVNLRFFSKHTLYKSDIFEKAKYWNKEIPKRMMGNFVQELSYNSINFDPIEKFYISQMKRLEQKISRLYLRRMKETKNLNKQIDEINNNPEYKFVLQTRFKSKGRLTSEGKNAISNLYKVGFDKRVIARVMDISVQTINRYCERY